MAQKQYKKYEDVPKKYRWNLEFLLEGKTPDKVLTNLLNEFKKMIEVKDSKYVSSAAFLKALKHGDKFTVMNNKLSNYISNSNSQNVVDPVINALSKKYQFEFYKLSQEFGSEDVRFFKNASKIAKWAKLPEFSEYKKGLEGKLDEKKHQLPNAIKEFRVKQQRADISAHEVFSILTDSETKYGKAKTSKGKEIQVTRANISSLRKHADAKVRKSAALAYAQGTLDHKETLANLLYQHNKEVVTWAKLENFNSGVESQIFSDRVDLELLETLYSSVKSNIGIFRKKHNWQKKFYKAKFGTTMTKYDSSVELVKTKSEYTVEETKDLVLKALDPFGPRYTDVVKKAFNESWIDFMPVDNKRSGAYSIGASYGLDKKLILMNFDGQLRAVETLAHEMGHSMHSYFSDETQPPATANYPIFVAEIASIFNELLVNDYLLENSTSDKEKFSILGGIIDGFDGTVVRQSLFSNYEFNLYKAIEKGEPVASYEAMSKLYFEASRPYLMKLNPKYKPESNFACIMVPHFYYGFYVYKYAIGQLGANVFFRKYKEEGPEALQTFIDKFLSVGAKDWPVALLKEAGVDLHDPKTYDLAFRNIDNQVNEWIKLGKRIFKLNKK